MWVLKPALDTLGKLAKFRSVFGSNADFFAFVAELRGRALGTWPELQGEYESAGGSGSGG